MASSPFPLFPPVKSVFISVHPWLKFFAFSVRSACSRFIGVSPVHFFAPIFLPFPDSCQFVEFVSLPHLGLSVFIRGFISPLRSLRPFAAKPPILTVNNAN